MLKMNIPSIWLGDFSSKSDFDNGSLGFPGFYSVMDAIDDRMLTSRHAVNIMAYCVVCRATTSMRISWHYAGVSAEGAVHPAWTETAVCIKCGLNSRMRALIDLLLNRHGGAESFSNVYIAERATPAYGVINKLFGNVTGSEYLGVDYKPGQISVMVKGRPFVRHEDLKELSFAAHTFDLVITQDVFEHIPDYTKAFSECARILKPGGLLVFSVPFFYDQESTRIRATCHEDGSLVHHLPPEWHGNPVSKEGSLCFQNFGWDLLPSLTGAGFSRAHASMYWGPWCGHLGFPFFIFSAVRS